MLVRDFIPAIHASLGQLGTTLFISDANLLRFINFAIKDCLNYEGTAWAFQYRANFTFQTDGITDDIFEITIPNADKEAIKRIAYINIDGQTLREINVKYSPDEVRRAEDIYFEYDGIKLVVKNYLNRPMTYTIGYFVNPKILETINDEIPLPHYFFPALFDFVLSYLMLPFGQYGEEKDHRFYERAQIKLSQILKSNSNQTLSITMNIK